MKKIKHSVLDLVIIHENESPKDAIYRLLRDSQTIDKLGYTRLWIAEHHGQDLFASAATSILIGHIAKNTKNIKIGSGGIMMANHSPLIVAEQFATLEAIYPARIDLGIGRSSGSTSAIAELLRRNDYSNVYSFKEDLDILHQYFINEKNAKIKAFQGGRINVPIWILGTSIDSALIAAEKGLPYAFGAHLSPSLIEKAVQIYKENFTPSNTLQEPYLIVCINTCIAEVDLEARILSTSLLNMIYNTKHNNTAKFSPPGDINKFKELESIDFLKPIINNSVIGDLKKLIERIKLLKKSLAMDEVMVTNYIYDKKKRREAFELISKAFQIINSEI